MDQIILLCLSGDNLVERAVLVEKQIRVSISKDAGTFSCQHEKFVPSIWYEEGTASIYSSIQWVPGCGHLGLASVVDLAR